MSEYLFQAPVILFMLMASSFALVLGPIAASDLIRAKRGEFADIGN